jgi:hypothetical protein
MVFRYSHHVSHKMAFVLQRLAGYSWPIVVKQTLPYYRRPLMIFIFYFDQHLAKPTGFNRCLESGLNYQGKLIPPKSS